MSVNVNERIRGLSLTQCKKIEVRAAELIAEGMILRELRRACQRSGLPALQNHTQR